MANHMWGVLFLVTALLGVAAADFVVVVETATDETNTNGLCSLREAIENGNTGSQKYTDCPYNRQLNDIAEDWMLVDLPFNVILDLGTIFINELTRLEIRGNGTASIQGDGTQLLAIENKAAHVTLRNLDLVGGFNLREYGAGCVTNNGIFRAFDVNFVDCYSFTQNTSTAGAVLIEQDATRTHFERCSFLRNEGYRNTSTYGPMLISPFRSGYNYSIGAGGVNVHSNALNVEFEDCEFFFNRGDSGGAVQMNTALVDFRNCSFVGNVALRRGGALASSGSLSLSGVPRLENNTATEGGGFWAGNHIDVSDLGVVALNEATNSSGGAMYSQRGSILIERCGDVTQNIAFSRGGAFAADELLTVVDLNGEIAHNVAQNGGAMAGFRFNGARWTTRVHNNTAQNGGVIWAASYSSLDHFRGNVADNSAGDAGGFLYSDGSFYLTNFTGNVTNNGADRGGFVFANSSLFVERMRSSISFNAAGNDGGAFLSEHQLTIADFEGDIDSNTAGRNGGFARAGRRFSLRNATTTVTNNTAGCSGGVVYSGGGEVILSHVTGDWVDNAAGCSGGAIANTNYLVVNHWTGDVRRSTAADQGGFAQVHFTTSLTDWNGNLASNTAGGSGGVFRTRQITINRMQSAWHNNAAGNHGGVLFANSSVIAYELTGSWANNTAGTNGGVVDSAWHVSLVRARVNMSENVAGGNGGVIRARHLFLEDFEGLIRENVAGDSGGVAYTSDNIQLHNVQTNVVANTAGVHGGAFFAFNGWCEFVHVRSDFRNNVAVERGGVMACGQEITMLEFNGAFEFNQAANGGAIYGNRTVEMIDVRSVFHHNNVTEDGGAIHADNYVRWRRVDADLHRNSAGGSGGAIYTLGGLEAENSTSQWTYNRAGRDGGVLFAERQVTLLHHTGSIFNNTADGRGGAVSARSFLLDSKNNTLPIAHNTAGTDGGVVWADRDVSLSNVIGDVFENHALSGNGGVLASGNNTVLISACIGEWRDNSASESGGAIYAFERVTLLDSAGSFLRNEAVSGSGGAISAVTATVEVHSHRGDFALNEAGENGGALSGAGVLVHQLNGSFAWNQALRSGGAIAAREEGAVIVIEMDGAIEWNRALEYGGAIFSDYYTDLRNVGGDGLGTFGANVTAVNYTAIGGVNHNSAGLDGGAVWANSTVTMGWVERLWNNTAAGDGGVIYSLHTTSLHHVGSVYENFAGGDGGVIWSEDAVTVEAGAGFLDNESGGRGGVAFCQLEAIQFISAGDFVGNRANGDGGVAWANGTVAFTLVGDLRDQRAQNGGVAYSFSDNVFFDTFIKMEHNLASGGSGGVAFARRGQVIAISGVLVANNTAAAHGGVFFGEGRVLVSDLSLGIHNNTAESGSGGAFLSVNSSVLVERVDEGISGNTAGANGGVAAVLQDEQAKVVITDVSGGISGNQAVGAGGVAWANGEVSISNLFGHLENNRASEAGVGCSFYEGVYIRGVHGDVRLNEALSGNGGVVFAEQGSLADIDGSVWGNIAAGSGGVLACEKNITLDTSHCVIENVAGALAGNSAGADGGVIATFENGTSAIFQVAGSIANNTATRGGVVFSNRTVHIQEIGGDIAGNAATDAGGVSFSGTNVFITGIDGSLRDNEANDGGVAYSVNGEVVIAHVYSIRNNAALSGDGGVAHAPHIAVSSVQLDVADNTASSNGGVGYATGDCLLRNVGSRVSGNEAAGDGGVFRCDEVVMHGIPLIADNAAGDDGGVAAARRGVFISDIDVAICGNTAADQGGVAYSFGGTVSITSVSVVVTHNSGTGSVIFANNATLYAVLHSEFGYEAANSGSLIAGAATPVVDIAGQGGSFSIAMSVEPSNTVAAQAITPPPAVIVSALASSERINRYPVQVEVNPTNGDPSFLYESLGNIASVYYVNTGEAVFPDLRLPSGTYSLTFHVFGGCGVSVDSVESDTFTVTACTDPGLVQCPPSETLLISDLNRCGAYLELPVPTFDPLCDTAVITNSFNASDTSPDQLNNVYPAGITVVTVQVETADRVVPCVVTVQVEDRSTPNITCAAPLRFENDPGECSAEVTVPLPLIDDNCDVVIDNSLSQPGLPAQGTLPVGENVVLFAAVPTHGTSSAGFVPPTCDTRVEVVDTEPPVVLECPESFVVGCHTQIRFFEPRFDDNCPYTVRQEPGGCDLSATSADFCDGFFGSVYQQIYIATDGAGNEAVCAFNITRIGTFYSDVDRDGHGDPDDELGEFVCDQAPDFSVESSDDCDPTDPERFKLWYMDQDGDGWGGDDGPTVCWTQAKPVDEFFPGASKREVERLGPRITDSGGDCNDMNPFINPGAVEVCDGVDNNCDGRRDEGC